MFGRSNKIYYCPLVCNMWLINKVIVHKKNSHYNAKKKMRGNALNIIKKKSMKIFFLSFLRITGHKSSVRKSEAEHSKAVMSFLCIWRYDTSNKKSFWIIKAQAIKRKEKKNSSKRLLPLMQFKSFLRTTRIGYTNCFPFSLFKKKKKVFFF